MKMVQNLPIFSLILYNFCYIFAQDSCVNQVSLITSDQDWYRVRVENFSKDCSEIEFFETDKLNAHLGSIKIITVENPKNKLFNINVSFTNVKWKKAFLKLTNLEDPSKTICKKYLVEKAKQFPVSKVIDPCFINLEASRVLNYLLEFKAELDTDILYKKISFRTPQPSFFNKSLPLPKRSIFMSVDSSSNYEIILKIQPLPEDYDIKYYKIEVFREKNKLNVLLDVRMLPAKNHTDELKFQYITYNEEGYYFFKVSVLNALCPEEACLKSVSSKVYIKRKYPPLVIGIVGASFIIPFVLFVFHLWTRRCQTKDEEDIERDKVFLIQNQTPETHYAVVKSFEKTLKNLTRVQIVKDVTEATHIVYVCGTYLFEPDAATYKHLMLDSHSKDVLVIFLPYSVKEIPSYLRNCVKYEFMRDFGKFLTLFNCQVDYLEDVNYKELVRNVKRAEVQTESTKVILNMPTIIVTAESMNDLTEVEAKEADVLL